MEATRRNFVQGGAVVAGALAVSGAATTAFAGEEAWDEEYDVIVVGAGLAGMAAATTVALEGDGATCLLLEKSQAELGGGNSQFSAGMVLWTKDVEGFTEYLKELRGDMNNTPDEVLAAYAEGIGENLPLED